MANLFEAVVARVGVAEVKRVPDPPLRRSSRPTKTHAMIAQEYAGLLDELAKTEEKVSELRKAARQIQMKASGVGEALMEIAQEYEDQTIKLKGMVIHVVEEPEEKSPQPPYKAGWAFWMGRTEKVIMDLKADAQKALEAAWRIMPGGKHIDVKKTEDLENVHFRGREILDVIKGLYHKAKASISRRWKQIENLDALMDKLETDLSNEPVGTA